ncbi:MAG: dihydrolipoyllysine-residue acetyltransferase [Luteitalea sp.]|nr:dihydrolipoyllysine-residue acetyltransferase [Luteitalea sp.]
MAIEFALPELGENITAGEVLRVLVKPGDVIGRDQPLLELETDKATIEVPSTVAGRVQEINVNEGDKVQVGQRVLTVEEAGKQESGIGKQESGTDDAGEAAPSRATAADAQEAAQPSGEGPAQPAGPPAAAPEGGVAEFKIPELGENVAAGDVLHVLVKPGDFVERDQPVIELETDKATVEVPSSLSGRVRDVHVKAGDTVKVGQVIFAVELSKPATAAPPAEAPPPPPDADRAPAPVVAPSPSPGETERPRAEVFDISRAVRPAASRADRPAASRAEAIPPRPNVPAAPSVRRLARELGLDVGDVPGSGPAGRISQADVLAYAKQVITSSPTPAAPPGAAGAPTLPDFAKWGEIDRKTITGVRRKTAEHLAQAWSLIPSVTQCEKADVTALEALRKRFAPQVEQAGGKLTVTAILAKILAAAVKAFPQFGASLDLAREELIYKKYVHVGIAVDTDRGLLVPVVRHIDTKNITQIAVEIANAAQRARDRKLTADEMEGGTITITNLGGLGGTHFSPIVNWPEVAILGVSRARMEPVWVEDGFQPRLMLPLSLSYDHRVIDGADAMRFLHWVVEALEQPFLLTLQG